MTGMRARARQCGGDIEISGVSPHGLRLVVTVPVRAAEGEPA
jgi:signal transduction histidine kinase